MGIVVWASKLSTCLAQHVPNYHSNASSLRRGEKGAQCHTSSDEVVKNFKQIMPVAGPIESPFGPCGDSCNKGPAVYVGDGMALAENTVHGSV